MMNSPSRGALREMMRRLCLSVVAVVALGCAGIMLPGQSLAAAAAPRAATPRAERPGATVALRRSVPPSKHTWRAGAVQFAIHDVLDRFGVEATVEDDDGDGDGDGARSDMSDGAALAVEVASSTNDAAWTSRSESRVDALRFAIGRGLPRAPPT